MTTTAYIALGANLGDPVDTLLDAVEALRPLSATQDVALSRFYQTAPVDAQGPDYINAVARFPTVLSATELLTELQRIEHEHGRIRSVKNAPRTLDLDLLLFGSEQIQTEALTVPHPRMHERAFVLRPLADLQPNLTLKQGRLSDLLVAVSHQPIAVLGGDEEEGDDDYAQ